MRKIMAAAIGLGAFLALPVQAEAPPRMAECNKEAAGLPAREREAFISACLAGDDPKVIKLSPQERMKECSRQAEGKVGEDRRLFLSACLKR